MAGPIGSRSGSGRQRVFVLVDHDSAKGVFFTWDAAEAYADKHGFTLEKLMEYETRSDYPDHLHLMSAKWETEWKFQGEWSRRTPDWSKPPKQIRLEHYHAKGNAFHLLRRREFDWEEGLLLRINPMAPDVALDSRSPTPNALPSEKPHWQPKVAPLSPLKKKLEEALKEKPKESELQKKEPIAEDSLSSPIVEDPEAREPDKAASDKLPRIIKESSILGQQVSSEKAPPSEKSLVTEESIDSPKEPEIKKSEQKETQESIEKPKLKLTPASIPEEDSDSKEEPAPEQPKKESKKLTKRKTGLRLRAKSGPTPIPTFAATPATATDLSGKSSVELAHTDPNAMTSKKPVSAEFTGKQRRVWSLKLILSLIVFVSCWAAGIYWVLRPEPTAASIAAEITTLSRARKIIIEPNMVFFQLDADPSHQERFIQNLGLDPIPETSPVTIPMYHTLDTWEKPGIFIRPPYADIEVKEWWDLKGQVVRYGFIRRWEDGSMLILDFETDTIVGWADVNLLTEILN